MAEPRPRGGTADGPDTDHDHPRTHGHADDAPPSTTRPSDDRGPSADGGSGYRGPRSTLVLDADAPNRRGPAELRFAGDRLPVDCLLLERDPYEEKQDEPLREFSIGVTATERLHRLDQDIGDGWMPMRTKGIDSFYVTPPFDGWRGIAHDPGKGLFIATPVQPLASLIGLEPAELDKTLRPLYHDFYADPVVRSIAWQIWNASTSRAAPANLFVEQALMTLVARTLMVASEAAGSRRKDPKALPEVTRAAFGYAPSAALDDRRLARATEYVDAHLGDSLTIAAIAAAAAMSPSQLSRRFKTTTGEPVWRYVQRRRLERACELLRTTARPIADIAAVCGYASQSHLGNALRAALDTTPTRYRLGR